jgi:Holliday junction resolvase RusA-like endonuclease
MTQISLPMPPSVNQMYSTVQKRRVKSKVYANWAKEAGLVLNTQHPKPLLGRVSVSIALVAQSNHRQDADNRVKAVLDLLTKHKIIKDDSSEFVREIRVRWMDQGLPCVVNINALEPVA